MPLKNNNPDHKLTTEEQSAGGKKSGETRRNKKMLRDCIEILLETERDDGNGKKVTGAEVLSVKLFKEAMNGNVRAFEVLRDTAGQKPVERVMISDVEQSVIDEVERMVDNDT